jgi:hypothetical protein
MGNADYQKSANNPHVREERGDITDEWAKDEEEK